MELNDPTEFLGHISSFTQFITFLSRQSILWTIKKWNLVSLKMGKHGVIESIEKNIENILDISYVPITY